MFERLHIAFGNYVNGASERFEGYRTAFLAFALFLLGLLQVIDPYLLASLLPSAWGGYGVMGLAILIYLLRQLTQTRSKVPGFRPRPRENGTEGTF